MGTATVQVHEDAPASSGLPETARPVVAALAWGAAATHLLLTPEHFAERTVYGVFFLSASLFQIVLGWLLVTRPSVRVLKAGAGGSLALIATWIVTRAVAPPLSPEGAPEPVTLLGVLATALELATLVLLASFLPIPRGRSQRTRVAWAAGAGLTFVLLVLLASSAVSYDPRAGLRAVAFSVWWGDRLSLGTPLVYGSLLPHVWVVGPWSTFVLTTLAGMLLALNVAAMMRARAALVRCPPRRRGFLALAPTLLVVSGCCGAPLALFFGASAVVALYRATPWILVLLGVTLATALAKDSLVRLLKRATRYVNVVSGLALVGAGAYLVFNEIRFLRIRGSF